jgi:hypothetical protein
MSVDKKILKELSRHNSINKYIMEQEIPAAEPLPGDDLGAEAPLTPPDLPQTEPLGPPQPIDLETDTEVEKIDNAGKSEKSGNESEELDITDLVTSQKNIETKQEEYFNNLFSQLETLQTKLGEMETIATKLNDLETKIEKYREKTPEERLELRSLDSGPFHQKLSDFFTDKQKEMETSGKNEYVLTSDEVENFSKNEIRNSFNPKTT